MSAGQDFRNALPVMAVALLAGATLATGWIYAWFTPMLLAVGLSGYVLSGRLGWAAPALAVVAPIPWVSTIDRAVLLTLVTSITWTACRLWSRRRQEGATRTERDQAQAAASAVAAERLRIARDLHDMVRTA